MTSPDNAAREASAVARGDQVHAALEAMTHDQRAYAALYLVDHAGDYLEARLDLTNRHLLEVAFSLRVACLALAVETPPEGADTAIRNLLKVLVGVVNR